MSLVINFIVILFSFILSRWVFFVVWLRIHFVVAYSDIHVYGRVVACCEILRNDKINNFLYIISKITIFEKFRPTLTFGIHIYEPGISYVNVCPLRNWISRLATMYPKRDTRYSASVYWQWSISLTIFVHPIQKKLFLYFFSRKCLFLAFIPVLTQF